jgi:hypothetical protein
VSTVLAIAGAALALAGSVVVALIVAEIRGWLPTTSTRIVRGAASRMPTPELQARYAEEWTAEVQAFGEARALSGLVLALKIRLSASRVAGELAPVPARAPAAKRSARPPRARRSARRPRDTTVTAVAGAGKTAIATVRIGGRQLVVEVARAPTASLRGAASEVGTAIRAAMAEVAALVQLARQTTELARLLPAALNNMGPRAQRVVLGVGAGCATALAVSGILQLLRSI